MQKRPAAQSRAAAPTGSRSLGHLTPAQREAVMHSAGPLLIIAGAGTGKTTVITERLAHLLTVGGLRGDQVLAMTFSNKATDEMESRLDHLMPLGYEQPWINTFHAFGERVLRENSLAIGISPDFEVLSPAQQQMLVRKNLFAFDLDFYRPLGNPSKFVAALVRHFSRAKDEAVSPEKYLQWAEKNLKRVESLEHKADSKVAAESDFDQAAAMEEARRQLEVAKAFTTYQKLLHESGRIDIADLITLTLELFRRRPSVLAKYRRQFKAILVDEFQDTNFAQYQLIRELAPSPTNKPDVQESKGPNLTVVADDDQAIYRWRGASVANVLLFQKHYPSAKKIALVDNFRSTQNILDCAYTAIQFNNPNRLELQLGINKRLTGARGAGPKPTHHHAATREDEVQFIVREMVQRQQKGSAWSDMAVLVRSNAAAEPVIAALAANQIPFQFMAIKGLFARPEILDLMAFLRVVADFRDSISLYRLLTTAHFAIEPRDLVTLLHFSRRHNQSLYETIERSVELPALDEVEQEGEAVHAPEQKEPSKTQPETPQPLISGESQKKLRQLVATLKKYLTLAQEKSVGQLIFAYVEDIKLLENLLKHETAENTETILNINQFFRRLLQFERESLEKDVRAWIEHFDLLVEAGENPLPADVEATPDAVKILTIHAAKGLEFPIVFVFNLTELHFPSITRRDPIELPIELVMGEQVLPDLDDKQLHLAEERRLFYVACTRARDELILTSCVDDGGARKRKPSRFLAEAGVAALRPGAPSTTIEIQREVAKPSKVSSFKLPLPKRFSYTQLTVFDTCPLQYKFAHMYKIPSLGSPTFSYGKSMHEAMAAFYRLVQADQPLPTKDKLLELLDQYWLSEWYDSKRHEQERKAAAREALSRYYDDNSATLAPAFWIERDYNLKIGPHVLNGRVDRADTLPDGTLEIIDYKTGSLKKESALKKNNQLALYALAAKKVFGRTASKLTWYFLDEGKKVTTSRTDDELTKLEADVQEKIGEIIKSDFVPTPSFACKFCDFKNICEAGQASGFVS